jgi:hypothetical protein
MASIRRILLCSTFLDDYLYISTKNWCICRFNHFLFLDAYTTRRSHLLRTLVRGIVQVPVLYLKTRSILASRLLLAVQLYRALHNKPQRSIFEAT